MMREKSVRWLGLFAVALSACAQKGRCDKLLVEVTGDHPHTAAVSPDKVKRGLGGTYRVQGDVHQHAFQLTDDDMRTLMSGGSVTTRTSSASGHMHEVLVRCEH